jgi:hypothetical protein
MSTIDEKPAVEMAAEPSTENVGKVEKPENAKAEKAEESSLPAAQVDGSGPPGNGSALAESNYKVEVKLADMQMDPNNPLFSAKSFEELKLYFPTSSLCLAFTNCFLDQKSCSRASAR